MNKNILSSLVNQINELAVPVGLRRAEFDVGKEDVQPPKGTLTWVSSFAIMALIPITESTSDILEPVSDQASEWIWQLLIMKERRGQFFDGYLIFALPTIPDKKLRPIVQKISLDTTVCRKHVIWPSENGEWREQLWAVTALGLPEIDRINDKAAMAPQIPQAAKQALHLYQKHKNYVTVAEKLQKEARSIAKEEQDDF